MSDVTSLLSINYCVIIPTYNNAGTLPVVISSVLQYSSGIIVVNDGSTDHTQSILKDFPEIYAISYPQNRGKGYALKIGFRKARELGFRYAITIDSDGQHYASDILHFLKAIEKNPDTLIVGSRFPTQENMLRGSIFANKFSNFWFHIQTTIKLPDTQSGFRLYPIEKMGKIRLFSNRYEAELELLVKAAWRFIPVKSISIAVYYPPPEERISHFRPFKDFFRISLLNTVFTIVALIYFYPKMLVRKLITLLKQNMAIQK